MPPFNPGLIRRGLGKYALQRAFLLYMFVPRDRIGPVRYDKIPCNEGGAIGGTPEKRAVYTFDEAVRLAELLRGSGQPVGVSVYPPKAPGLFVADLDGCFQNGKLTPEAARLIPTETYVEVSPLGEGAHILFDVDQAGYVQGLEAYEVCSSGREKEGYGGLYGPATRKHITLTGSRIEGSAETIGAWCERQFTAFAKPLTVNGSALPAAAAESDREADEAWHRHWLAALTAEHQQTAVEAMLDVLRGTEWHDSYGGWRDITFALRDLGRRVSWNVKTLWDRWSAGSPFYDPKGNEKAWASEGRSNFAGKRIHWSSLVYHARAAGFDIRPWHARSRRAVTDEQCAAAREAVAEARRKQTAPDTKEEPSGDPVDLVLELARLDGTSAETAWKSLFGDVESACTVWDVFGPPPAGPVLPRGLMPPIIEDIAVGYEVDIGADRNMIALAFLQAFSCIGAPGTELFIKSGRKSGFRVPPNLFAKCVAPPS